MALLQMQNLKHYKDIAWLLLKYGRSDLVKEMGADFVISDDLSGISAPQAEELVQDLEALGPTYVKMGQFLSSQVEFLPDAYIEALSKLQDKAEPFPFEEVEKIFFSEFKLKIRDAFKEFDPEPIAAGSLSQVHKARLPSNRVVAVKVQRPNIREKILEELEVFKNIATFLEQNTSWGKRYGLVERVTQLSSTLIEELDFTKEATNLVAFKNSLKEFPQILIPSPIPDYTSSRVLTMDFISGSKITDLSPLVIMELDGESLARTLFKAYLKQVIIDGLVHIDPHPGNIYLSENNEIIILDLGMVTRIPPQMQTGILKVVLAISDGRGEDVYDLITRLGNKTQEYDDAKFRDHISNLVAQYQEQSEESIVKISIGRLMLKIAAIAGDSGFILPSYFNLVGKALINLDRVAKVLAPNFNPNEFVKENATGLLNERMQRNFSLGALYRTLLESGELLQYLPVKLNKIFDILSKNELSLKVDAFDEKEFISGLEKIANRITLGIILAALIIGAALLMRVETAFTLFGYPGLPILFFLGAAIGGTLLIFNILIKDRQKK